MSGATPGSAAEAGDRPGLLLVNLGTPATAGVHDVRDYLEEFLSDPRVLDVPAWKRWLILRLFILPFRPRRSAEAYAAIWTERGSPLLLHGEALARKVGRRLGEHAPVELAMRYGEPSIGSALARLRGRGAQRIVVFPLYPQYSSAATGSTLEAVYAEALRLWNVPYLQVVPPFFDHPAFLDTFAALAAEPIAEARPERVFFSFHGLPERQVRKGDEGGAHCLRLEACCERIGPANLHCYRAQCFATARRLADRLRIAPDEVRICFQSRLGREPWIRPYTEEVLAHEARSGVRRAAILSPAFVADCLETIEELGIRALETWREHGGESLALVPCPNADDRWADAVVRIARDHTRWLDPPRGAATADRSG